MPAKLWLTLGASLSLLAACATHQENPNYAYSTKYKAATPTTTYASAATSTVQAAPVNYLGATTTYASASSSASGTYSRVDQECLRREKNHELIGAAVGGSLGAWAGKELIGGTTGAVVGAGLGGATGYGIGDKTVNCDPQTFIREGYQAPVNSVQQASAPTYTSTVSSPTSYQVPATHTYASNDQSRVVYQSPHIEYQAPTDTQFQAISDEGTPGFQVLQSQVISQPVPTAVAEAPRIVETSRILEAPQVISSTAPPATVSGARQVNYDYSDNVVSASAFKAPEFSETRISGNSAYSSHLVRGGDTVYSLARRNCVSVTDIQSINGLNSNFGIKIGDSLKLPASRC